MNEHDDELQVAGNYEWRWRNKKTTMRMTEKKSPPSGWVCQQSTETKYVTSKIRVNYFV